MFKTNHLQKSALAITHISVYSSIKTHSTTGDIFEIFPIGKYWVDGYDENKKIVYEFLGCYYHGHSCLNYDQNKFENLKIKLNYLETRSQKIITIWECQFKKMINKNNDFKKYYQNRLSYYRKIQKIGHIKIRESFYGGRTNNLQFYRVANEDEEIKYLDFCSLYPYVLKNRSYPIGHPEIISENFDYSSKSYFGFIECCLIPPKKLYLPVLPLTINNKLIFPLCVKCATKKIFVNVKIEK